METLELPTKKGVLYLIPSPLGGNAPMEVLPLTVRRVIEEVTHFIVENEKDARSFIKRINPKKDQNSLTLYPLNKFTLPEEILTYLDPIQEGVSMGVISDAGCPGVADPGAEIVKMAHRKNITIRPLVGPSSILMAVMSSGLNGQNFAFNGYIPIDKSKRKKEIKKLLGIVVLSLFLTGCAPTTSEFYSEVKTDNKVIGMPKTNKYIAKGLKKLFRQNGWKIVVVDLGSVKTTGTATDSVNLEAEYKSNTNYVVSLSQSFMDICWIGNDKIYFDLTIIDSKTGEETFIAEGNDCEKTIIKDLESQLSPFWN